MQNKTINTMRYHLTPVRIDFIKKSTNNKCWKGYREKGTLLPCWWKCELILLLWRTVWRFFKKIKLPYDPTIPLLGIYTEKKIQKDAAPQYSLKHCFTIARTCKQPKCPLNEEWIKMWYIHTMEYYSVTERNEIMPSAVTWVDLETVIQTDIQIVIQTDKDKYVNSVIPICLQPHELPARLLCPWNFPGKNTGVGCHFLHQGIFLN